MHNFLNNVEHISRLQKEDEALCKDWGTAFEENHSEEKHLFCVDSIVNLSMNFSCNLYPNT